jgi:broad specificity phosphatase PhoE
MDGVQVMVLDSVDWGKPVLSLLSRFECVDRSRPAVMIVRHSEVSYRTVDDLIPAELTERGEEAVQEFGSRLPRDLRYRMYHTCFTRTRQTAEGMAEGLRTIGARVSLKGELPCMNIPQDRDLVRAIWNHPEGSWFISDWLSHRLPNPLFPDPLDLAKRAAREVLLQHRDAGPGDVDVYASHGEMVALYKFYWLGIPPVRGQFGYLNGFILQLHGDALTVYTPEGVSRVPCPCWWEPD